MAVLKNSPGNLPCRALEPREVQSSASLRIWQAFWRSCPWRSKYPGSLSTKKRRCGNRPPRPLGPQARHPPVSRPTAIVTSERHLSKIWYRNNCNNYKPPDFIAAAYFSASMISPSRVKPPLSSSETHPIWRPRRCPRSAYLLHQAKETLLWIPVRPAVRSSGLANLLLAQWST